MHVLLMHYKLDLHRKCYQYIYTVYIFKNKYIFQTARHRQKYQRKGYWCQAQNEPSLIILLDGSDAQMRKLVASALNHEI